MSDVQQELPAAQRERIEGIGANDAAAAHKRWNNVTLWMGCDAANQFTIRNTEAVANFELTPSCICFHERPKFVVRVEASRRFME